MPHSPNLNDFDGDFKSFESIVDNLRALLKKAYANVAKEHNRANDLEKKMKKRGNQAENLLKLKRQPLIRNSKSHANALDEAIKAKDEEIQEMHSLQNMLEQINAENKKTIDNLRKDVRQLNLEVGTQKFLSGNCENLEEIHKIYNLELMKLDEQLNELKEKEGEWKEWPKLRKVYEDELENLNGHIEELETDTNEWKVRMNEYEAEIDRLKRDVQKRKPLWKEDILFNGSAGLLMAGSGISKNDIDFIVQDNINELRDSHVRKLGTVIPLEDGISKKGSETKYPNAKAGRCPFNKDDYIKELEELNKQNMDEIEYLKIEENLDYKDGNILEEIEELKARQQDEVRLLNEEIAKLRSCDNGDIWQEVEELKKEHEQEVNLLQVEIEELKTLEGGDISEEVEELKINHLEEVESLWKELEILRLGESGDIFEEVESLKKRHSEEVECLKNEIQFLKGGAPGFSWIKDGEDIGDEWNRLQEDVSILKNTDREKEFALVDNAKEREIESLKEEIEMKDKNGKENAGTWDENFEDANLMLNEINRLNGVIQLMSKNYTHTPESSKMENKRQDSNSDAIPPGENINQGSATKELKSLNLVDDEAVRAEIQQEYDEKMNSLLTEMLALKNIENEQIWKDAQEYIDKELDEIKTDFIAMSNAKNADEWERSMDLYDAIRRLKAELLSKNKMESTEIGRLREEVRYLKQELSNLRKANEHFSAPADFGKIRKNCEEKLHATNPFYPTGKDEHSRNDMPSVKGNEDEEMWNLEVRPLLEDIAILNDKVNIAEESLASEKMNLTKEIEALKKENSDFRRRNSNEAVDSLIHQDPNRAYTDDEKLAKIVQELDHVQQLQIQADEKATNYERQLEEERSRHSEEMKNMADNLRSLKDSINESEAVKAGDIEEREEEIKNLKNTLDDVRGQHEQEIQEIGEMCKEKTDALDDKISDLKISLGSRENELIKKIREIDELLEKIELLEQEIEELKEEKLDKDREIDEREKVIKALRSELEEHKNVVKKTLNEKEKTYALYQQELGRVHIQLLTTKSSHEELLREMEEVRKCHAEELVCQKEKLEDKFEMLVIELKRSHEDEIDQIRIEMLSAQDKFKEFVHRMKNRQISEESVESIDEEFDGLSRIISFDSDDRRSGDGQLPENFVEKVARSKSDSDIFGDDIIFENGRFENPSIMEQDDDQHPEKHPFVGQKPSQENRMTQSMDEIDAPDSVRKDERKFKNKKKNNKSKRKSRDAVPNFDGDDENLDEVELKEKQKQCRQQ